jgi:hypothetical protein
MIITARESRKERDERRHWEEQRRKDDPYYITANVDKKKDINVDDIPIKVRYDSTTFCSDIESGTYIK